MFRLSKITDYGIVLLVNLARAADESPRNARELAEEVDLPLPVVSKTLKALARHGLLTSQRGAKGGFLLSRDADNISVANMIEALEGPVALTECNLSVGSCAHEIRCQVRDPWQVINRVVHDALNQIMLSDLARSRFDNVRPLDRLSGIGGPGPNEPGSSTQPLYRIDEGIE
jgi:FeS assembly SUF system regulator